MEHGIDSYQRFLDGDESALAEIIASYKDGLILYLNGFVGDLMTAEELTEETFVKLVLKRPVFYRTSAFKTWLYAIARNTAMDHLRRHKRQPGGANPTTCSLSDRKSTSLPTLPGR